jgi:hypothetical protein
MRSLSFAVVVLIVSTGPASAQYTSPIGSAISGPVGSFYAPQNTPPSYVTTPIYGGGSYSQPVAPTYSPPAPQFTPSYIPPNSNGLGGYR